MFDMDFKARSSGDGIVFQCSSVNACSFLLLSHFSPPLPVVRHTHSGTLPFSLLVTSPMFVLTIVHSSGYLRESHVYPFHNSYPLEAHGRSRTRNFLHRLILSARWLIKPRVVDEYTVPPSSPLPDDASHCITIHRSNRGIWSSPLFWRCQLPLWSVCSSSPLRSAEFT